MQWARYHCCYWLWEGVLSFLTRSHHFMLYFNDEENSLDQDLTIEESTISPPLGSNVYDSKQEPGSQLQAASCLPEHIYLRSELYGSKTTLHLSETFSLSGGKFYCKVLKTIVAGLKHLLKVVTLEIASMRRQLSFLVIIEWILHIGPVSLLQGQAVFNR